MDDQRGGTIEAIVDPAYAVGDDEDGDDDVGDNETGDDAHDDDEAGDDNGIAPGFDGMLWGDDGAGDDAADDGDNCMKYSGFSIRTDPKNIDRMYREMKSKQVAGESQVYKFFKCLPPLKRGSNQATIDHLKAHNWAGVPYCEPDLPPLKKTEVAIAIALCIVDTWPPPSPAPPRRPAAVASDASQAAQRPVFVPKRTRVPRAQRQNKLHGTALDSEHRPTDKQRSTDAHAFPNHDGYTHADLKRLDLGKSKRVGRTLSR